ncbi:hypothetical protein HID58_069717 [Brassica napus]|uniref:Uncharacterized protein n=1 Tax=Brassica napus TaxID=3708 RepID=A0ABQ7YWS3_BRANA|nr:hypothetical protein HID58_069717 [Brassica napus]
MPSQPNHLEEILCNISTFEHLSFRGHRSPIVEVRLLRFLEARTFKRGGELMGWKCFSLCQGFLILNLFLSFFFEVLVFPILNLKLNLRNMEAEQGAEELKSLNHNRVELERLRRIEILSDSATTSTKDYRDSNISGREAMQSSDDITINSTASVKRRGKGPIVVRKTYCSLLDPSLEEHTASSLCVSSSKLFFIIL